MKKLYRKNFPMLLQEIPDPPRKLYSRGALLHSHMRYVAIVGTRLPTDYGLSRAYDLAACLVKAGVVVVSGLAFGIDASVHRAAIDLDAPTVAVLASGVENVTPSSHQLLAEKILAGGGTLLSEYEQFDSAHKYRFLERNRIISGLCEATVVIEAKERSGALITAHHAFDQNREVYALVGDVQRPQVQGCLNLIASNIARPLVSSEQFMEEMGIDACGAQMNLFSDEECQIFYALEDGPLSVVEIMERTGLPVQVVNAKLGELEVRGIARSKVDGTFILKLR